MSQLPHLPEDDDEAAQGARLGVRPLIVFVTMVVVVVTTLIVLHLTGVIRPTGH